MSVAISDGPRRTPATRLEPATPERAAEIASVPTRVESAVWLGLFTLVVLVGGFLAWALLAPLNSAVLGGGTIVVETSRRDVQHLEGGIVREIFVRDGVEVQAGDVLLTLDPTRVNAALQIVRGQMDANLVLLARLRAEVAGADRILFEADLLQRAATDRDLRDLMQGQQQIFLARRASMQGQIDVLRQRIIQIETQIQGQEAQERARLRQIDLIQQELVGVYDLLRGGFAPRTRALALERELARLQGEQGEYLSGVARSRQQIGEAQLQILQIERSFQEEVTRSIQETQNSVRELQERVVANNDIVRHMEVRAPVSGTVVGLTVFTSGGVVQAGRTLMQIVPRGDVLLIEAQIAAQDIEVVHEGQQAMIRFPALPQRTIPTLTGTVLHVSADRLTDERSGMPFYKVRVRPDEASLLKIAERRLVPGMPAEITIATGQRTAARYLIDPLWDAIRKAMRER
jgi:HlyD family secretion protein/epimerase transport system membrane fusion protein